MEDAVPSHGAWSFRIGPTAMTYEGDFILSKGDDPESKVKHGQGFMRWQDGREYRGQFAFDKMQGEGTMVWPTGAKYVGQYCDNRKGGLGKLSLPDGSIFEGNWYQGIRHGDFLYIDSDGSAFRREYENDELLSSVRIPSFDYEGWTVKPRYTLFVHNEGSADSEDKEDPICSICLSELSNGSTCCKVPCQHVFHKECIDNWTRRKNQCPLCLQKIPLVLWPREHCL